MTDVNQIFGIRKQTEPSYMVLRQSIEQTEDYAVKKVVHTQELYVNKFILDIASNTYFKYNNTSLMLELFVNGVKVAEW